MNYAGGKFEADGLGSHSIGYVNVEAIPHHGNAETITIPDAHLLFAGEFERSGTDLIVSDREHRVVVTDYFRGEKRPVLVSPEGAPLDSKVIEALSGHTAYAQAGTAPAAKLIGHVVTMTGSASIVRNGVTIAVNNGDNVYQNDVVQTGSGSTLGLVLDDGTAFNLSANARLMLNDLVYDASSTSNSALFTLVQGAASFVAGQVAKTGDMKVATPVASIGIRGTMVILNASATDGTVSISVVDQHDGLVHAVQVFNTAGALIGTVTSNGTSLTLTPAANFNVIAQESNKTVAQVAQEFSAFQGALATYDLGKQMFPSLPQHTENTNPTGDPNATPGTTKTASGSTPIVPPDTPTTTFTASAVSNQSAGATTSVVVQVQTTSATAPTGTGSLSTTPADAPIIIASVPPAVIPFVVTPPPVTLISTGSGDHVGPVMSADGRFVTYDPDGAIFLFDRQSDTTITIAAPGGGFTYSAPTISADGHYIVFQGSNGTQSFVFIYDNNPSDAHYQQTTQLMSGSSPAISGDGSTIVVEQGGASIGVYDQQGHAIATITPAAIGETGAVWKPAISADGHVIAFWNSDAATTGGSGQLFIYNLSTGTVTAIANTTTGAGTSAASISADGHYVVYQSDASDGHSEIFLYDLAAGHVVFQTANAAGASYSPVISPDGHFIIFASDAQLTPDDTNSVADTYVVDVTDPSHPVFKLVSELADGTPGNAASNLGASISAGGLFVAFGSSASNLSTSGTGGTGNIFVVDATSGHSAVIQESASSPPILSASGVIELTGDASGVTLTVSDLSGKFSAAFDSQGNIEWNFNEAKSDFASLQPGQVLNQNFVITLSTESGTTTIPVRVSVLDADLPTVTVTDVAPVASPVNLTRGPENAPYIITAAALLAGVADIDGPSLSITAVTIKSGGGGIVDNGNGTWTYTPPTGFTGAVAFNYTASDGTLSASSIASLDLISPTVTSITAPTGDDGPGAAVSFTVNFSEVVTVDVSGGIPTLTLSNGATATYVSGSGTNALLFNYTVGATGSGEDVADLATATTNALALNGGTITDATGNAAVLTGADNVNPAGILQIDTLAPTVTTVTDDVAVSVTSGPISFTATFSEAVTGVSAGSFTATNGTVASVTAVDSSHYTILVNPTAGVASGSVALSLVDGGATDTAGNAAVAADLSSLDSQGIDTLAPAAPVLALGTGVANGATAAEATAAGGVVTVTGELNDSISVTFTNGIHTVTKTVTGTGSAQAVTLSATDLTTLTDGTISVSATQTDAAGNAQTVAAATTSFVLDTLAPAVTAVTDNIVAPVTNGAISFTATFSEAVTGVSAGSFTATNGTVASVTAVDSSHYTVVVNPTAGVASGNVALSLVAGGATDAAGNAAVAANLSGLDSQGIDTLAPAETLAITAIAPDTGSSSSDFVTSATTLTVSGSNGALGSGEKIQVSSDGGTTWTDVVQNTTTSWSLADATTHPASFIYQARIVDTAGNVGTTASHAVTIDTSAPVATPVTLAAGTEDTAYIINASTLLAGVSDVDGPFPLTITAVSVASGGGSVVDNHNGTFTYTPALNYNGPVSFNYTASDGTLSSNSTASLTLAAVNDAPVATPVTLAAGTEDTAYIINASTLLAGVSDVDGPFPLTITAVSVASGGGSVVNNGNGTFTYTPALNYNGPVSFNYTASDGSLTSSSTASLTLAAVNDAPVITAASLIVSEGGTVLFTPASIGITDPDSSSFTYTVTNVSHGVFQTTTDGVNWFNATTFTSADLAASHVRFVQDGSATAPTFSIQANDGAALNNLSNVFVGSVNFVPVAGAILGDSGDNTLVGTPGNDVFQGFGGNDILEGGDGRDKALYTDAQAGITIDLAAGTVQGTAPGDLASIGTDTLQSIEYIVGSNFADTFDATGFSNTSANAGSVPTAGRFSGSITNYFEGGGGDDTVIGNGATMVSYDHAAAGVTVDLAAGTAHGTAAGDAAQVGNDTLSGVTGVRGSAFDDTLLGNNDPKGVDVFYGGAGNDLIDGRAGYDLVVYSPLIDNTVTGGITVNMAAGTVVGDASVGTDTLRSVEAIRGTNFNDTYNAVGFSGTSTNAGSLGTFNQFEGMGGNDTIIGNGNTTVEYSNALAGVTVDITAGTAQSTLPGDAAGIGVDSFSGVNGIKGSEFDDILSGSSNPAGTPENFTGGGGNDTINGRGGFDRAIYSSTIADRGTGPITVNMAAGTVVGDASVGSDTLLSIEAIRGTNFNDIYDATGFSGSSTNAGSFGTFNEFEGMGGNDTITGNGNTRIAFYNANAGVTVNLATGTSFSTAPGDAANVGVDTISGVNAVTGSAFADNITGDGAANILNGGGGNDAIDGGAGTDLAVYSGPIAAYTISFNTPSAGQIQVADSVSGRDGTDTLSNIEALEFTDGTVLVASGTAANPINLAALTQGIALNAVTTLTGNANDFIVVNPGMNGLPIDLGAGTGDTVILGSAAFYSLNLVNVENVTGTPGNDTVNLLHNANGLAIDLGGGNNSVNLANGSNSLAVTNVQSINATDFSGTPSNDTLTLLNDVSGISINLAQGNNTLNLAAGSNTLTNAFVQTINGTASDDSLTLVNNPFNVTVDLGAGNDTLDIVAGTGFFSSLTLLNVEHLTGSAGDDSITLLNNVSGLSVDLGAGNNTLSLANGSNSLSATNVQNINGTDFSGTPSNDTLNLLNDVSGVSINLGQGINTLNLTAGVNSLANVFNVASINGTSSADTLTLAGQVGNPAGVTKVDLGAGNDTLSLGALSSGVVFVYADNDGADVVSGFNPGNGDKIDLTGVSGVHSLADVQSIASAANGTDTVITFAPGNTLTLTGILPAGLVSGDFLFAGTDIVSGTITGSVVEAGGVNNGTPGTATATGTLSDNASNLFTVAAADTPSTGGFGTYQMTAAGTWTYTLNNSNATVQALQTGAHLTDTFTVTTAEGTPQLISIDITGANDAAVISGTASGSVTEAGGVNNATPGTPTASGTLTDTDVDNPVNTFTPVAAGAATTNGFGTFQMTAAGTWTYTLDNSNATVQALNAASPTLTDSFTVTTVDGTSQLVTVTIHGANDAAAISGTASGSVTEAGGVNNATPGTPSASGTLTDTDVDNPANTFTPVAAGAATTNGFGTFQMTAAGTWTYTLDNSNATVQALNAASPPLTDSFTVTTVDGTSQLVTVTIHGANDTPVITAASLAVSEGATVLFTAANVGITDPDNSSFTFTVTNVSHGSFQTTTDGTNWVNANTFTSADLAAGHVCFVQDGSATAPTFSIQADDGAGLNNLSNIFAGSVSFTIVNNAPVITAASLTVSEGGTVLFTPASLGIIDPDSSSFTFSVTNVSHGSFQTTPDGVNWINATSFTTADLAANHVRFVHDDSLLVPTFSIQANDGAAVNNLSNVFAGSVTFTPLAGAIPPGDNNNNTLTGTPGNDVFQGFGGDDSINGLGGFDRALYTDATGAITVNLAAGTVSGPGVGNDTLTGIEGVVGSDFADTFNAAGFTGSSGVPGTPIGFNEFEGRGGNDTIITDTNGFGAALTRVSYVSATAGVTVDIAAGTADGDASVGHDTFVGPGILAVWGSAFADTLEGSNNGFGTVEIFAGFAGNDTINGRGGFDRADYNNNPATTSGITVHLAAGTVTGDATVGTDTLISVEAVRGTNFADIYDATGFSGTSANAGSLGTFNEFTGEGGDDTIIGNGNTRISYTNATGPVTVDIAAGTASGDASVGNDHFTGVNAVMGSMFADSLSGSAGNETFTGLGGNDFIDGRGGFDTVSYNNIYLSTGGVSVNLAAGTATGDASIGTDTLRSIEAIQGTNAADAFVATGYGLPGALNVGNNGTFNQFEGLGGDDIITGNGNTRIAFYNALDGVTVDLAAGTSHGTAANDVANVGTDTFTLVNAVAGSAFADIITGSNNPSNTTEEFAGRAGNDFIDGKGGFDRAYYSDDSSAASGISVDMASGVVTGDAAIGTDTLRSIESIRGTNFADTYVATGFSGSSVNAGSFGAFNEVEGLGGNDQITGNGNTRIAFYNALAGVTVDLAAGTSHGTAANDVANVGTDTFTLVNAVRGSNFADTIFGDANANTLEGRGGNDFLDGRGGGDFLAGGAGADTFVYAKGYGALTISDFDQGGGAFNQAEGDQLQLTGFTSQPTITNVGGNTVEDFGNGDVLTLLNVSLQPAITGDLSVVTVKGTGVQLTGLATATTTADLQALDPGFTPDQLTFTVTATSHGHLATSATGPAITSFTQTQLNNGSVFFVADSLNADGTPYVGQGSFTVTLSDGVVVTPTTTVGVTIVDAQLSVLTAGGYNFDQDNSIGAMGSGTIVPDALHPDTTFEIVNTPANRDFVFSGSGFTYNSVTHALTGGTITSILETTDDASHTPLASFALNVDAAAWMNGVIARANGNQSLIETLVSPWTFNFIGNAGADAFGASDNNDIFTGKAGNDNLDGQFGFDRANYGAATAAINVQLAAGIVTGDASVGTDTLQSIEMVTGSNFADTFDATGFSSTSSNAGSTVTSNTLGLFNEFEGRGGNDVITGNGSTRISYLHSTSGVAVTFDGNSWNPAFNPNGGASGTATGDASIGTDTFTGVNSVRGTNFNDAFTGSNNPFGTAENFEGLAGNDIINGGGGFDRAIYNFAHDGVGITVNLADGTVTGGPDTGTDTLQGVEGIWGTEFADIYNAGATTLNPGGFSPTSTNAGNSPISPSNPGASNFNEFEGGGGNDTITGNGNTRIAYYHATGGVVVTLGASGSGTADGNVSVGHDTIISGVNAVAGSEFNDILTGNGGNNTLDGRGGNDVLSGNGGNDTLIGGTGSDIFVFKVGVPDSVNSPSNNDTIADFSHSDGDRIDLRSITSIHSLSDLLPHATQVGLNAVIDFNYLHPTDPTSLTLQNITLTNLTASDFIFASALGPSVAVTVQTPDGYDFSTLYGDLAASSLGASTSPTDHIFAVDLAKGITFELIGSGFTYSGNTVTGGTVTEIDILNTTDPTQTTQDHVLVNTNGWNINAASLFSAIGAYQADNTQTAGLNAIFNAATYSIVGSAGSSDNNHGSQDGADVFFGGDHADVFNGMVGPFGPFGPGSDTVDYSHAGAGVTADLSNPANNTGAAAGDIYISIENLRGTAFNDVLTGDGNNNVIEGGLGNDVLNGGPGGFDTVSYEHATAGVTVSLNTTSQQDTVGAGLDTLSNFEALRGSSFNDTLTGNGNSVLEGGPGDDHLIGVTVLGQSGDTASYEHATAGVTVSLALTGPQNTFGAGTDTLTNIANLFGSQFSDTLIGDNNNNILNGGNGGSDVHDTLTGGGGADTFVFNNGNVTITDFSEAQHDVVDISHANNGSGFTDAQLAALLAASNGDTLDFGNNNVLTFTGIAVNTLHVTDFLH